jgi:hypothetical protein
VVDAATHKAWQGTETTGAKAYDTDTVTASAGIVPTGKVTYGFYAGGACAGSASDADTVTLTATGAVPNSSAQGPLGAGSYSFRATYSGDTNYVSSASTCEPFRVGVGTSSTATQVFDPASGAGWTATEISGATAYDTASITPSADIPPTGTITYNFFPNNACLAGTGSPAGGGALVNGVAPHSSNVGPLASGTYSFDAVYAGDANYGPSTSNCEPFAVDPAPPAASVAAITPVTVAVTG